MLNSNCEFIHMKNLITSNIPAMHFSKRKWKKLFSKIKTAYILYTFLLAERETILSISLLTDNSRIIVPVTAREKLWELRIRGKWVNLKTS